MSKRYDDVIEVVGASGRPATFTWRGRRYEIDEVLETWREAGRWWTDAPREEEFHRVLARPAGAGGDGEVDADGFLRTTAAVYDLCRDRLRGTWRLVRLWD